VRGSCEEFPARQCSSGRILRSDERTMLIGRVEHDNRRRLFRITRICEFSGVLETPNSSPRNGENPTRPATALLLLLPGRRSDPARRPKPGPTAARTESALRPHCSLAFRSTRPLVEQLISRGSRTRPNAMPASRYAGCTMNWLISGRSVVIFKLDHGKY